MNCSGNVERDSFPANEGVRNSASRGELSAEDAADALESILIASMRSRTDVVFGDDDVTMPKWYESFESFVDNVAELNGLP
jgi:hypothetical protein